MMKHLVSSRHWEVAAYRWKDDRKPYPLIFVALVRGHAHGLELGLAGFHLFVARIR